MKNEIMITDEDYQRLGLTQLQGGVILTLLELGGEATAPEIITKLSNKQKVNRTSIYSVLTKLEQMHLLISTTANPTIYSLISTSPKVLMEEILRPQQQIQEDFVSQLHKAKAAQSRNVDYELFYLKSREQIVKQTRVIIEEAEDYLLIMANAMMLVEIEKILAEKVDNSQLSVLIIPTWNPDPSVDFLPLIERYRNLVGADHVVDAIPIFRRILPMMLQVVSTMPAELQPLFSQTNYIQVLSQKEMLMATFTGKDEEIGSGFYSREPFISMMLHFIYISLFEEFGEIDESVTDPILKLKINSSLYSIKELFT